MIREMKRPHTMSPASRSHAMSLVRKFKKDYPDAKTSLRGGFVWVNGMRAFDMSPMTSSPMSDEEMLEKFKEFVSDIKKMGEVDASKEWLDSYKQKIIDINKLHDNIIFFIYNVGGYPFRHPYDFGKSIDKQMLDFFEENGLKSIYLSFEGQANYGIVEEICNDEEFWEYYHINNPKNRSDKDFKKYWSLISPKGWISIDPHPNSKADELAIKLILDYVNEREKKV